jgi:hypothetical protein
LRTEGQHLVPLKTFIKNKASKWRRPLCRVSKFNLSNKLSWCYSVWPPLLCSGQSSWLQIQRSRVRFPALPDFLRSSGSGTGSTQPREDNWGATWMEK